jgi:hypothetical protein
MWASKGDGANRRPSGQTDASDTLSATLAAHRAFPVAGRLVQPGVARFLLSFSFMAFPLLTFRRELGFRCSSSNEISSTSTR